VLSEEESQRIQDCVNGCRGIGNPLGLPDLIVALDAVLRRLEQDGHLANEAVEVQELWQAVINLQPTPPPEDMN
jgi:hypothetical protein